MSNISYRTALGLVLLPVLWLACDRAPLDDATRARVVAVGDSAAMSLVRTLGARLGEHMAQGGPAGAIAFCSAEAQTLTDSVSAALGEGWAVKRTTTKTRNPRNAPDSLEAEALRHFHDETAGGAEPPEHFVQATPDGDYRYYRPLRIAGLCLQCHGPRETLDPGVRQVLDTRYPADQATGYSEGDLRGLVRVTVPREAVR